MSLFDKNKESKTPCPHCQKNLPNGVLAYYLFNRMTDETECPHCQTKIKLQKNITKFVYWQAFIIAITIMAVTRLYWTYIELSLIKSGLAALLVVFIEIVFLYSCLFKKMKFEEA